MMMNIIITVNNKLMELEKLVYKHAQTEKLVPNASDLLLVRSISARLLGLLRIDLLANEISAMTRVMIILQI